MNAEMTFALAWLAAGGWLLWKGIRKLHEHQLAQEVHRLQWENRYLQQETDIALNVSHRISRTFAARLAKVYGSDYADYLIARQMNLPASPAPEREPMRIVVNRNPEGINLYPETPSERRQREQRQAFYAEQYGQQEYDPCADDYADDCADDYGDDGWFDEARDARTYTPPHSWQPQPQAPALHRRPPPRPLPHWHDDDVIDVEPVRPPVYPPALLPPQRHAPPSGRQRKYASNAERQRAYRARKAR